MEYYNVRVSWDEKLLKRKGNPQGVEIVSKGWNAYMRANLPTWAPDVYNRLSQGPLFTEMPRPIVGKLSYPKSPIWDYMEAYPFRAGMHACVSERVKTLFEKLQVSQQEYRLEPISVAGVNEPLYLFFTPQIVAWKDIDVDYESSRFVDFHNETVPNVTEQLFDELRPSGECSPRNVVAKNHPPFKDILQVQYCSYVFISARLLNAFHEEQLIGIDTFPVDLSFV